MHFNWTDVKTFYLEEGDQQRYNCLEYLKLLKLMVERGDEDVDVLEREEEIAKRRDREQERSEITTIDKTAMTFESIDNKGYRELKDQKDELQTEQARKEKSDKRRAKEAREIE